MNNRSSSGPLVAGTLLIAFGVLALLSQLFRGVINWSAAWPLSIVVFGALFFAGMFAGGKGVSGLAIPGAIITGIGLLMMYQNLTGHWESWAYAWSLIVLLVGAGIYIAGAYGGNEGQKRAGVKVMRVGFILFVLFGAFFEMIFSLDRTLSFRGLLFPALLILLGVYLILSRLGLLGRRDAGNESTVPPQEPPADTTTGSA